MDNSEPHPLTDEIMTIVARELASRGLQALSLMMDPKGSAARAAFEWQMSTPEQRAESLRVLHNLQLMTMFYGPVMLRLAQTFGDPPVDLGFFGFAEVEITEPPAPPASKHGPRNPRVN